MSYQFMILGPVQLLCEQHPVTLGSAKRRAMLTALALDANRPVSLSRLTDAMWAGAPPSSAEENMRTHACELRRSLHDRLVARTRAYELRVADGELDAAEFVRLAAAGRTALRAGDASTAIAQLAHALALWHGVAGDGIPRGTTLDPELTALDEQRLDVFEDFVDARLRVAPDPELVAELRRHLTKHPLRERAWGQLMTTSYRCGNVVAALDAYSHARRILRQQLGIEPGQELAALQRAILARDPALGAVARQAATVGPPEVPRLSAPNDVPHQLPQDIASLVGRGAELSAITTALRAAGRASGPPVVTVSGPGGVGKSTLAIRAAHAVADEFPDGQVAADLRGSKPDGPNRSPDDILGQVLRALGVPLTDVPSGEDECAALYRSLVADRRVLVLIDDAATAAQLRPLIPGSGGSALLVTRRRPLATVDGAVRVEVGPLSPRDSTRLLASYIGEDRIAADPASTSKLVRLCAGLPLALRIVGARLASRPGWGLDVLADELADRPLDGLQLEDLSIRGRFASDYHTLVGTDELAARSFRLLGSSPGGQVTWEAAAAQLDEPAGSVVRALEQLVDARLADSPRPGRYRLPDLVRLYAAELAATEAPAQRSS
jgi:DNA-binding SARP family transcriptional activator